MTKREGDAVREWKYTLKGHRPVRCLDPVAWARWFASADRHVAFDRVGGVEISTVFLGLDHGFGLSPRPILFETMIFGGPFDEEQRRYTSWADAEVGHREMLARVQAEAAQDHAPRKTPVKSTRRRIVLED